MSNSFGDFNNAFETPFPGQTPVAEVVAPNPFSSEEVSNVSEEAAVAVTEEGEAAAEKSKREMAPRLNSEQKKVVIATYAKKGSEKVAEELGVNVSQVRNVISQFRKDITAKLEAAESEEEKAKFSKFIEIYLPKRVTGEGKVATKRVHKSDNQSIIDDLLKDLMV